MRSHQRTHEAPFTLVRQQRRSEALESLETAARLAPDVPRYAYTYAVALRDSEQPQRAVTVLEAALERHPHDRDLQAARAILKGALYRPAGR